MSLNGRFTDLALAPKTVQTYEERLNQMELPATADEEDLRAFKQRLNEQMRGAPLGTALPTRAAAWHYLVGVLNLEENEAKRHLPRVKAREAKTRSDPTGEQRRALWLAIMGDPPTCPRTSARRAILLMAEAGMRLMETLNLMWPRVESINEDAYQISVTGKGGKTRDVFVVGASAGMLHALHRSDGLVFPGRNGRLHPNAVRNELHRMAAMFPVLKGLHPHLLRHWFAFGSLDAGANLVEIQAALGHESLETTAIYTRPSLQKRLEAARKTQAALWR